METLQALTGFYEQRNEELRLEERCGRLEYLTTMRYIEKYLKTGMRVIEIGAGTGRYSRALAAKGYRVDAVELIEHNIEVFRQHVMPGMDLCITRGNAMNLHDFADESYDVTLLLGPLYHLFTEADKLRALSEAVRVTKKGGVILAAYCMVDASILQHGFVRGNIHELIERSMLDPVTFAPHSEPEDVFELHRKQDIDRLRSHFPVTQLNYVATDGYANHMRDTIAEMDDATFELYVRYHLATCELPELTGYSNHTLDIFQKDE